MSPKASLVTFASAISPPFVEAQSALLIMIKISKNAISYRFMEPTRKIVCCVILMLSARRHFCLLLRILHPFFEIRQCSCSSSAKNKRFLFSKFIFWHRFHTVSININYDLKSDSLSASEEIEETFIRLLLLWLL